ncbi:hypothetical protein JCM24511_08560 [Saitozyma sp. JCM 24511]|nr:hypothetical protein JCM24511_08560 [Saitozyma sp. JCM 24511]
MRTTFFTLLTAVLAAVVTAERAPAPGTRFLREDQNGQVHGNQVTRQELSARANHPDLFEKRNILTAEETAAFMLGRGSFTWDNGTTYSDPEFQNALATADVNEGWYHRVHKVVRDTVGNAFLQVSIPYYKKWKAGLKEGDLVRLSSTTAIRALDIHDIERILLEREDFEDIQWRGFKADRRFFEVARSY